ncbi:MAG TPA: hypothetical protein VN873_05360 [Candidatus Angelobacter sp.]|nr:hypothetical protein [Candidatus Angelobacter sp.]
MKAQLATRTILERCRVGDQPQQCRLTSRINVSQRSCAAAGFQRSRAPMRVASCAPEMTAGHIFIAIYMNTLYFKGL